MLEGDDGAGGRGEYVAESVSAVAWELDGVGEGGGEFFSFFFSCSSPRPPVVRGFFSSSFGVPSSSFSFL